MPPDTIPRMLHEVREERPSAVAFRFKRERSWRDMTWAEAEEATRDVSCALLALGVAHAERVAILSQSRIEWVLADFGIVGCGAVTVGIYPTNLAQDCAYVLAHSEACVVFVEDAEQLAKIIAVRALLPALRTIVRFDGEGGAEDGVLAWQEFLALAPKTSPADLESRTAAVRPEDVASIVYTSGTTGVPKGAMLTHRNVLFAADSASRRLEIGPGRIYLLFLPLAHVFARLTIQLCLCNRTTVAFAEGLHTVAEDLRAIRPHFIAGVPRVYEKLHDKIVGEARRAGGVRERIFRWALRVGMSASALEREGRPVPLSLACQRALADRLVFRKVRAALGGRLEIVISGAAPLDPRLAEFFHAFGIVILEGIGMTENSSFSNVNSLRGFKFGTVGRVGDGIEMKVAPDGEILFRGPNVMTGYYKDPEGTAQAIDAQGWLRTGDVGEVDAEGFLKITDRKKDLIVTSGGKNVAPQRIERALSASRYLAQSVVFGDRRKFITALVTLDEGAVRDWIVKRNREPGAVLELARDPEVLTLIAAEVENANRQLASFETVKRFRILPGELSIENGELTPTLKIRRKVVAERHGALLDEMYQD